MSYKSENKSSQKQQSLCESPTVHTIPWLLGSLATASLYYREQDLRLANTHPGRDQNCRYDELADTMQSLSPNNHFIIATAPSVSLSVCLSVWPAANQLRDADARHRWTRRVSK